MTVTRRRYRSTFTVLTVAVAAFALLQSLVIPVLGELQRELHTDQATITWVLTAYLLSASICTPLLGRLGDVVGKKRMLVLTLIALSVGSLMAALSPTVGWLIVARVVQGAGGGVLPLSFGIIRDEFPREKMNSGLSILASLAAAGFGVGIVVAGPIVDLLGYHWLFWLPMIATGLAAVAALTLVPESPGAHTRPDPAAAGAAALRVAGCTAARAQPGQHLGLGVGPGARSLRGSARAGGGVDRRRDPGPGPAHRHADDACARGLDRQRGRCLRRVRALRLPRVPAPAAADSARRPATASGRASPSPDTSCCRRPRPAS